MNDEIQVSRVRWRPLKVMVGLCLVGLALIWGIPDWTTYSLKGLISAYLMGGTVFVLLLWFLFFSRLGLKIRLIGFSCFVGLILFLFSAVEIREVSGDVAPILAWSWTPRADEGLENKAIIAEGIPGNPASTDNDYPRFLGSQSTGVVADISLARDWEARPPVEKWRIPVGAAWSGFAVKGNLAITQEQRGEKEMVTCYNLQSGELIWAHIDSQRFSTTVGGDGPRATPTITSDKVYTMGALGLLNCLELATGKLIWQKDVAVENKAEKPRWGYSSSPLVINAGGTDQSSSVDNGDRELVVVSPGGPNGRSLVAYDADTGAFAWAGGSAEPGYSSPQMATLAGTPMILIFNNGSMAAHHPENGQILWEIPWPGGKACVANPRCLPGDRVLVSAGYGMGSKMYRITGDGESFSTQLLYESPRLKAKFANFMLHGEYVYGLDDGVLTCMKSSTGERVWKKGRYGHGQLLLVGDLLLVQAEGGELHLLEAKSGDHHELASISALSGKSWNTMALAGNRLLMRNHKEAVCLALPLD